MNRILGNRGASAVTGLFMLAMASSATAATPVTPPVNAYQNALSVPTSAAVQPATKAPPASGAASAVSTITGSVVQAQPARTVTLTLAPEIAKEASWLYSNGWPLYALVDRYRTGAPLDEEANCVATAVYFEARGEALEGQLAVAHVVMNRAASGKYPASWCGTVKQPAQFSFVRRGQFPRIDYASDCWAKAQAITRLAISNAVPSLSSDVLWYHADYVAPGWGKRLQRVDKIGAHIFYRA
ncbi:MAG: cell wall hydrolase [Sphingomicrobium sp.]